MNRHERRREAALARQRKRALSRMVDEAGQDSLVQIMADKPKLAGRVILKLAYAAWRAGRVTDAQARLFGARITKGKTK